ncbi:MAG: glycoside hydrolase family 140 protein [Bacteroidales bacterium]|nr:glycoside hydrolase family 140 protein [Bacteroidales bacterium]
MGKNLTIIAFIMLFAFACSSDKKNENQLPKLKVSENGRFFQDEDGNPFFYLGDTGWLLLSKLNREDAEKYLEDRKEKGFNVIQVMVLHNLSLTNVYGDSALINHNVATPAVTKGSDFADSAQYDYWDHVDFIVDLAAQKGLYMGLVPVWGGNVKGGHVTLEEAKEYATFLAKRYKKKSNVIWLNGGDIMGSDSIEIWNAIGNTINDIDDNHLITFHPRGRTSSSWWFHNEPWLDFNMFQSGHRRYDQDDTERAYGEDNWNYIEEDYALTPVKPTLDGEPSYEQILQGLHDTAQPYWNESDVRRYAYWSVFAGGAGFTYGHNAIMQFHKQTDTSGSFGVKHTWQEALNHPGAGQMQHLKKLILSKPYFERIPDQSLLTEDNGEKYERVIATRGQDYAFLYTYTGFPFKVNLGRIKGDKIKTSWYSPREGTTIPADTLINRGVAGFDPPGASAPGMDWVLIMESL